MKASRWVTIYPVHMKASRWTTVYPVHMKASRATIYPVHMNASRATIYPVHMKASRATIYPVHMKASRWTPIYPVHTNASCLALPPKGFTTTPSLEARTDESTHSPCISPSYPVVVMVTKACAYWTKTGYLRVFSFHESGIPSIPYWKKELYLLYDIDNIYTNVNGSRSITKRYITHQYIE